MASPYLYKMVIAINNLRLPAPTLPQLSLLPNVISDAIGIAIVIFVVTVSVGKLFAKKHGYHIDPAQVSFSLYLVSCIGPDSPFRSHIEVGPLS